ncbi:hypothetical protein JSE7799_02180 [Jannaschia seosinensis]|uniref:Uncharacterized protein n=1 Tax=Jannaschia seosinensis TaxID=313367 RepID=A0A0M7BC19_9RHOB|nr:hypothetical protein JSE7799_02180 [Jannaschia seosinensis]
MAVLHAINTPEIGDDAQPGLAGLVPIGLDDLQVAASAALGGAHKHGMQDAVPDATPQHQIFDDV